MISNSNLESLIHPKSVAIVGASERTGSLGQIVLNNLLRCGYKGEIYLINPKYAKISGMDCYGGLSSLPNKPDCAIICLSAHSILPALDEAVQGGVKSAIIFAVGFADSGEEGQKRQAELVEVASKHEIAVCGPNGLGFINTREGFVAFGANVTVDLTPGRVAAICQSGSIAIDLVNSGRNVRYSHIVSSGNEAVLTFEDYLEYFLEDETTNVVIGFVEGFRKPIKLHKLAARALELDKPIILLKAGRSGVAREIALAHTGAMAGAEEIHEAFFRKYGITRVHDLNEMLEVAEIMGKARRPKGHKIGLVCMSGGELGISGDLAEENGLEFAQLTHETMSEIKELLPPFSKISNPLDAWGYGDDLGKNYGKCLKTLAMDPNVDLVAVSQDSQAGLGEKQVDFYTHWIREITSVSKDVEKPFVFFSNIAGAIHPRLRCILEDGGFPLLQGTRESLRAIHGLINFSEIRNQHLKTPIRFPELPIQLPHITSSPKESALSEHIAKQMLAAYEIPITREKLVVSVQEAQQFAKSIGYPVVAKVGSPDIQHKSEAKGVVLNIKSDIKLAEAYNQVLVNAAKVHPSARIEGVLIQEMLDMDNALEVIIGAKVDRQFGPVVIFGLGGIFVELMGDVSFRLAPITEDEAWAMIREIRGAKVLEGIRGLPPIDTKAIVDILLKVSKLIIERVNEIRELDINPLIVFPGHGGAVVADALIVVQSNAD